MFINNKYYSWYCNIIQSAQTTARTGYTEKHHIIPKSFGGLNDTSNLVRLSAREHFICHRLLVKCTEGQAKRKMYWALHKMMYQCTKDQVRHTPNSRTFEILRQEFVNNVCKKQVVSEAQRQRWIKMNESRKGTKLTDKHRKAMSDARQGRILSEEHKAKISQSNKGKPKSEEHKEKIRQARLGTCASEETKRKKSEYKKQWWANKRANESQNTD